VLHARNSLPSQREYLQLTTLTDIISATRCPHRCKITLATRYFHRQNVCNSLRVQREYLQLAALTEIPHRYKITLATCYPHRENICNSLHSQIWYLQLAALTDIVSAIHYPHRYNITLATRYPHRENIWYSLSRNLSYDSLDAWLPHFKQGKCGGPFHRKLRDSSRNSLDSRRKSGGKLLSQRENIYWPLEREC